MKKIIASAPVFASLLLTVVFASSCSAQIVNDDPIKAETEGVVTAIRGMSSKRAAHTASLLNTGKVLLAGGFIGNGGGLSSTELYDPQTKSFSSSPIMTVARASHTATLLNNGKVLIAGGYNGDYLNSAEVYDPVKGNFTTVGRLVTPRSGHIATLLNDGRVLLAGGVGTGWTFLSDAEIFDPKTSTFTPTGGMTTARESHTATLLDNGTVLITGGHKGRRSAITIYLSTEIYNPKTGRFKSGGNLTIRRHKHDATLLADGRVLVIGGSDERDGNGAYRNAEIFNPEKETFAAIQNNMNTARYKLQGTAILLKNGNVLIAGGADRAEVFDPARDSFTLVGGDMGTKRLFATATLLKDGQVLITGGYTDGPVVSSDAWIYHG